MLNIQKSYNNLFSQLWVAYSDRLKKACLSMKYDIGFRYKNDDNFEKGAKKFVGEYKDIDAKGLVDMAREDRNIWQNLLAKIRNDFLEHKKIDFSQIQTYYQADNALTIFNNCSGSIVDTLVILLRSKLAPGIDVYEIPRDQRDPIIPKKFGFRFT